MADKFDIVKFVRNKNLLKESIGGYVDLKPIGSLKETFGDEWDPSNPVDNSKKFMDHGDSEEVGDDTRIMDLGGDQIEQGIASLLGDGFSEEDVLELCKEFIEGQSKMKAAQMGDDSEFEAPEWQQDRTQNREFNEGK